MKSSLQIGNPAILTVSVELNISVLPQLYPSTNCMPRFSPLSSTCPSVSSSLSPSLPSASPLSPPLFFPRNPHRLPPCSQGPERPLLVPERLRAAQHLPLPLPQGGPRQRRRRGRVLQDLLGGDRRRSRLRGERGGGLRGQAGGPARRRWGWLCFRLGLREVPLSLFLPAFA